MTTDPPGAIAICRACVNESTQYKSLHKEGIILGEVTTLSQLLNFCTGLEFSEQEVGLSDFICNNCVHELATSYLFKKKVLESNDALRSQLDDEDDTAKSAEENNKEVQNCNDVDNIKDTSRDGDKSETDLQELAKAAQMKRELESNTYESADDYSQHVIQNDDDESQHIQDEEGEQTIHHMDEDDDIDYVVQEVAETTEIYHTTEIDHQHVDDIVDIEEEETDVQQVGEDEEEVEFEIHVNDIDDNYHEHEIITDDPVIFVSQRSIKRDIDDKTNSESENVLISVPLKGTRNRNKSTNKVPNPDYQCKVCGKQLSNSSSYKYHMQLHSDHTPYKCDICGDCFKTRNAYEGHRSTHDPENPNTCELCGKSYRQPSSLRLHMLSHTGEKPFTCTICGKSLTQKSGYKKHMLTHTGEKPYPCDICGKSFRISSNMLVHRRSHVGEKPFVCTECEKSFGTAEQLKRHMMVHTDDTPFRCNFCGKKFKRQSTLRAHVQNHVSNADKKVGKSTVVEI